MLFILEQLAPLCSVQMFSPQQGIPLTPHTTTKASALSVLFTILDPTSGTVPGSLMGTQLTMNPYSNLITTPQQH